jgi:hypothetical protein
MSASGGLSGWIRLCDCLHVMISDLACTMIQNSAEVRLTAHLGLCPLYMVWDGHVLLCLCLVFVQVTILELRGINIL